MQIKYHKKISAITPSLTPLVSFHEVKDSEISYIICKNNREVSQVFNSISFFAKTYNDSVEIIEIPEFESNFFEISNLDIKISSTRAKGLYNLSNNNGKNKIVITTTKSMISKIPDLQWFQDSVFSICSAKDLQKIKSSPSVKNISTDTQSQSSFNVQNITSPTVLLEKLIKNGYTREDVASYIGSVAVRGGLLDVVCSEKEKYRIIFDDNGIEKIKGLNVENQSSYEIEISHAVQKEKNFTEKSSNFSNFTSDSFANFNGFILTFYPLSEACLDQECFEHFRSKYIECGLDIESPSFQIIGHNGKWTNIMPYVPLFSNKNIELLSLYSHSNHIPRQTNNLGTKLPLSESKVVSEQENNKIDLTNEQKTSQNHQELFNQKTCDEKTIKKHMIVFIFDSYHLLIEQITHMSKNRTNAIKLYGNSIPHSSEIYISTSEEMIKSMNEYHLVVVE